MPKRFLTRCAGGAAAAAVVVATLLAAPASALSPADQDLLASSQPKTVLIDTTTGAITEVFAGFAPAASIHDQSVMDAWLQQQRAKALTD